MRLYFLLWKMRFYWVFEFVRIISNIRKKQFKFYCVILVNTHRFFFINLSNIDLQFFPFLMKN